MKPNWFGESRQQDLLRNALKIFGILYIFYYSNHEFFEFSQGLIERKQYAPVTVYVLLYGITLLSCLTTAFHPNVIWRLVWGALISASTTGAMLFFWISQTRLTIFDVFASWNATVEAGRFVNFYTEELLWAAFLFLMSLGVFLLKPGAFARRTTSWLKRLVLLPLFPIIAFTSIVYNFGGVGYYPLPRQFISVSFGAILANNIIFHKIPTRQEVTWQPGTPAAKGSIVYLVDESIRADYIDLTPGNPYTPEFAKLADQFVNFGPASSAGNCSNYSNLMLRYGVSRQDLSGSANTNAPMFAFAKKAGFRTIYIDGQSSALTGGNKLVNFMDLHETSYIDQLYFIDYVATPDADEELGKIIAKELKSGQPIFVYANKNGSHFPYDTSYPPSAAIFHPTITESKIDTQVARIASYRNGIAWATDRFMKQLFSEADLSKTTIIYTSDHGQLLEPGKLTHCQSENVDPKMHVVPLMVHTDDTELKQRFEAGAALLRNKASHFQIAPTLLYLMGYKPEDIATKYDESLLIGTSRPTETTSGDIFGLLGAKLHWNPVDLSQKMMEPQVLKNGVITQ